ncbi:MAG: hypothetical protein K1X82_10950 [Bacteroidia bacterium]|nr:hypothetical protein [Bacteroidia bacterium]
MTKIIFLFAVISSLLLLSCNKNNNNPLNENTCTDGIQNRSETGVDCGGECLECPNLDSIYSRFYLQFKKANQNLVYQSNYPYFEGNLTAFPLQSYQWGALLNFYGDPKSLEGKSLSFNSESAEYIEIVAFNGQNKVLSSAYPPNQSGSNCFIRKVELVDTLITGIADTTINYIYTVKGDFNCRVSNTDYSTVDTLNYGKFSLRIAIIK